MQQHKKCTELLKEIYLEGDNDLLAHYNELQSWIGGVEPLQLERKSISDRYHYHLQYVLHCQLKY